MKRVSLAVAAFTFASVALCQLSKYKDWPKSPEADFLTAAERQEWSGIKTDEEAEKFIAGYWARRGGARFKEAIDRRIAAADEQFKMRRQKGSESARGRIFITLGNPSRVLQTRLAGADGEATPDSGLGGRPPGGTAFEPGITEARTVQTWVYDKDKFDASWGIGEVRARILIDPERGSDELTNAPAVGSAIEKIAEKSIVNPAAAAPAAPAAATGPAPAASTAAPPPPPAPAAAALPAATRGLLEALLKEGSEKAPEGFFGGNFQTVTGEPFYAFQILLPAEKAAAGAKMGGVVTKEDGQEVSSFWEDAAPVDMKRGNGMDKAFDRSIVLPAGKYRAALGVFPPDGGSALASVSATFTIPDRPSEFTVSPLILASTLTPLTKRPSPTDPFVFGMEKPIRVEPKGNRLFTREDGLWYFYTVSNAVVPPPPAAPAPPALAATPAPGAPAAAPATPVPAPKPRIMTRIGVLRDGKPAFQPATMPAELQPLGADYYASGIEIPLQSFEPGYYTLTLTVRDLNAPRDSGAFKGVDRRGDFVVLTADGSMPPKLAPPPARPTPRPRKKP